MISAVDPEDRVRQLITLTERLTAMLAAEAAAFEQRRAHTVVGASEEMGRLANLYRHESVRVKADPRLVAAAAPALRLHLMQATEAFEAVLARHGRALDAARRVTEGLVHAIAEEVASARAARTPYGPGARTGQVDASAITLNKRA